MNNETATLLATAIAKTAAHDGLVSALDFGVTHVLRINGLDHVYATDVDGPTFDVTIDVDGNVRCNGYAVNSTCRDLAYGILRAARSH